MLKNYSVTSRPVANLSQPVLLKVGIALNQIIDLDEKNQVMLSSIWLRLSWKDEFFHWNESEYQGLKEIRMPTSEIWKPDLTLYNDVREEERPLDRYSAVIYPDGTVFWLFPVILKSYCKLDVTYFPYDQQNCPFKFGSWGYHGFQLDVTNRSVSGDMSSFIDNGEWELVDIPVRRHEIYYGCCPEPYPDVTFYVIIKRRSLYYIFNIVLPCILIVSIALVAFYLPPESGEKVSLVITVLLALTVFMLLIAEIMPPQSEVVPLIGQYFVGAISLLSLSTALTVFVMNLHYSGNHGRPVPNWLRKLTFHWIARIVCMTKIVKRKMQVHPVCQLENGNVSPKKKSPKKPKKRQKKSDILAKISDGITLSPQPTLSPIRAPSSLSNGGICCGMANNIGGGIEETNNLLNQILTHITYLGATAADYRMLRGVESEWHLVAIIIDRLLLMIFALMTLILTLFFLCFQPSYEYSVD
ncbi:neuronal acetylcholine receptor subunit alpha-7-like isoform X2 [Lingula anatina]|nr:neuronal acetylcholine receptor subunit alpha-7-like isoform X2 [Lingula anatina]|eukprot:XP_013388535.1 neuronal acetylcholine receptor subunit alpha-7-like isoform X2 [Lingula anatina]